jgi:hypothetical protein
LSVVDPLCLTSTKITRHDTDAAHMFDDRTEKLLACGNRITELEELSPPRSIHVQACQTEAYHG